MVREEERKTTQVGCRGLNKPRKRVKTTYPDKQFTFNQWRLYLSILVHKDISKANTYSHCLSKEQRDEVLQSIKLKDIKST